MLTGATRCAATGLQATGIPSHLIVANELTVVVQKTEQLQEAVLSRCDGLPARLTDVMMNKFSIHGAIPVTMEDMKGMISEVITQVRSEIRELQVGGAPAAAAPAQPSLIPSSADSRFQVWMWGGRMHMVPQGWKLPSTVNAVALRPRRGPHRSPAPAEEIRRLLPVVAVVEDQADHAGHREGHGRPAAGEHAAGCADAECG